MRCGYRQGSGAKSRPLPILDAELLSDMELFDDSSVSFNVNFLEVVEKVSSVTYHLEKSTTAVVILVVVLEVLCKIVDSVCENRDLYLGRTCVAFVCSVLFNNCLLFLCCHFSFHLSKNNKFLQIALYTGVGG